MIPSQIGTAGSRKPKGAKWKSLDLVGVGVLTVSFILLIFAVTSGSTDGWKSPVVLILLIISIIMIAGTTTDMVLQQLLCSVGHCTFAILLVEWGYVY
ncbi:hypothetical protein BDR07DRAFT_1423729 [Suillus spraguei]|nr:hypothetical protein BDR07DRAFT_1423729 [Suillus spraguei]